MVSLNKVTLDFTDKTLFNEIGFLITREDRIGLVGRNGAGKSTLLKVLAREQEIDKGEVAVQSGCSIGYLPQELDLLDRYSLMGEMEQAMPELVELEQQLARINSEMSERSDYESEAYMQLIQDLNDHTERYGMLGGYTFRAEIEKILKGLGFKASDFEAPTATFSGGWRMRVELAKLLVRQHDLLLLDEPTNHLDIESIIWLEQFLKEYSGGIVLVSHDRTFLDQVTNRTVELSYGKAYDFPMPYSRFVTQRAEQRTLQIAAKKNQEKEVKRTEELIEKFRYKATKASFAQSLIKKLDKMELIEVEEEDHREMRFRFSPASRSGRVVVHCDKVGKSYGEKEVLRAVDLRLERGERIAFVGQNGQGKSTLVKIIIGQLKAEGLVELGHQVELGYYAQNQTDELDGEISLLQTIEAAVIQNGCIAGEQGVGDVAENDFAVTQAGSHATVGIAVSTGLDQTCVLADHARYSVGDDARSIGGDGVNSVQTLVAFGNVLTEGGDVASAHGSGFGVSADDGTGECVEH